MDTDQRNDLLRGLRDRQVTLIGVGAIGSWVARWLLANGVPVRAFDGDVVALKNLAAGAFARENVGSYKIRAIGIDGWSHNWTLGSSTRGDVLVCADHGPTRRDAARVAAENGVQFVCAKANGSLWQVWHVAANDTSEQLDTFCMFDEAAEADPVTVPCGDSSVGRVASIGAAAEMLSVWAGFDVTAAEVEASFGQSFDPALGYAMQARWDDVRADAEEKAREVARRAFDKAMNDARASSDKYAEDNLADLRVERAARTRRRRASIHQRAIVALDTVHTVKDAARQSVDGTNRLAKLAEAEAVVHARMLQSDLSLPSTIALDEVSA